MNFEELLDVGIWVVNKKDDKNGIYIGRGGILGNKFVEGKDGDREEVIEKYRGWLWEEVKKREGKAWDELRRLLGIWKRDGKLKLSCFCFPKRCHGEVIGGCLVWMKREGM